MDKSEKKIQKLRVEDASMLSKLESESFSDAWNKEQFEKALQSNNYLVYGIKVNKDMHEELISYITLSVIPSIENMVEGEFEIINIATKKEYLQQGYADALISHVKQIAKDNQVQTIFLDVRENNKPALNLYLKQNFNVTSKRKNYYKVLDVYEDALLMSYIVINGPSELQTGQIAGA